MPFGSADVDLKSVVRSGGENIIARFFFLKTGFSVRYSDIVSTASCAQRLKGGGTDGDVYKRQGVDEMSQEEYRKAAIDAVKKLSADVGIPSVLEAVKEEDLQFLADSAHADACAPGNPKDASVEDLKDLFRKIMA